MKCLEGKSGRKMLMKGHSFPTNQGPVKVRISADCIFVEFEKLREDISLYEKSCHSTISSVFFSRQFTAHQIIYEWLLWSMCDPQHLVFGSCYRHKMAWCRKGENRWIFCSELWTSVKALLDMRHIVDSSLFPFNYPCAICTQLTL